ncbi:hypothetical protein L249_6658 [Ophiocordyceps polyrhachis-furcata BCC 54312]|uniref:Cytochrome P450 monooxygenase n=1 Tax=Ophiocordyceps polyrhachis-furcata BCC 54312 TaxID=1330021 RepID=A0A367LKX4_9HYPO|nr:hypothetical protein L249_6658 [Ophiocordyceps polyrhachis-furcata BCC 54312]
MLIILLAGLAFAYGLYSYVYFPIFLSPLNRFPTPHWSCSISHLFILRARKQGRENKVLREAHLRCGSVVRVAPDALSVDGVEAVRTVYQRGFDKWPWYSIFNNYGAPCIFSSLGSKEHSQRKRVLSHLYSKTFIQSSPALKAQSRAVLQGRLLPLLRREAVRSDRRGTEMQSILMATTMDLISAFIFGMRVSTNFLECEAYRRHWLNLYLVRHHNHFWPQELPTLTWLCVKLGIRLYPSYVDAANEELRDWNMQLCNKARDYLLSAEKREHSHQPGDEPVVFQALHAAVQEEDGVSIQQLLLPVASETLDQVLAGHETAGIVLTYLTWRLSQDPTLQTRLRAELLGLKPSRAGVDGTLPDVKALDDLPLLHAVVMETLRLHAPIPGPQPRQTPYPSSCIGGVQVQGGVRIAALAHTLHLNEAVYPDPERWHHSRWLDDGRGSETARRDMIRHFWAFGSGGRMCLGSNFAMNGMKLIAALIYSNFHTSIVEDDGMEQTGGYSARPRRNQLFLKLTPVES